MTSVAGTATVHDDKGNLTFDPVSGKTYSYDSENRLKTATAASNPPTLSYDPIGRLRELAAGTGATRYGYDGLDLVTQHDETGTLWRRYVYRPGIDEPLVEYDAAGNRKWLHADEPGSMDGRCPGGRREKGCYVKCGSSPPPTDQ